MANYESNVYSSIDALGIYLLNLLLAFLQPKFDPSLEEDLNADEIEEGGTSGESGLLPSQNDDEFRPFVRRLPEWNFWCANYVQILGNGELMVSRFCVVPRRPTNRLSSTRAILIALVCSFFEAFDIPVYWPILLMYFIILFCLTMRRQIQCVYSFFIRNYLGLNRSLHRHMIKYKYIPFDFGRKARYGSRS